MRKNIILYVCLVMFILTAGMLYSQENEFHGADSVYEVNNVAVFWAVLKNTNVDTSKVYINIVPLDLSKLGFTHFSVLASNVFTGEEETVIDYSKLFENENLLIQDYQDFRMLSKRRILFYNSDSSWDNPAMEIYYLGVPDTAPVFLKVEHIQGFFEHSLNMIQNR
jgi:hypothetical protein